MTVLTLQDLSVKRGACPLIENVSLTLHPGECVGLLGPNGAGKTTLMRAALGLLAHDGTSSLAQMTSMERARACAWLPQAREIAWPVSVERLVRLGRLPHSGTKAEDTAAVADALAQMGLQAYAQRTATQLSGGEQARVLIARALAQDTPLMMADEPIAGLDPAAQIATMRVFSALAASGRTVLTSLHDLGLAARHCSRVIMLHQGGIVADGPPAEVMTPENLAQVFGILAHYEMTDRGPVFQTLDTLE
ncbi:ABC transporter ATP-binding protein [Pseudosulfitobacter koreensis]|uniref:ABC transporter ATP-binding protein n=1 Tax=Pseudosulfitobacter koreensis TaxID=2968472 RepID=A0ABT1YY04_9RHOB|nr:ABC transporter ATP-binding protein [Pseudosulfitobacter koreense]MCR8825757.1 ABC transporter ATP-binding protein [Pseudosulfitobacter koreense]